MRHPVSVCLAPGSRPTTHQRRTISGGVLIISLTSASDKEPVESSAGAGFGFGIVRKKEKGGSYSTTS